MAKLKDLKVTIGLSKKGLTKLNADLRRTKSNFKRNFGEIAGMAKNAALVIGTSLIAGISAVIKAGADMERVTVGFRSIMGGAEGASRMVRKLNRFAANTPFQLEDISTAARQLLAVGVKESALEDTLKTVGDIAAATGSSITEISAIYAKANAKGKIDQEILNQLLDRGINIKKELLEVTNQTGTEFEATSVSVEDFNQALRNMADEGGFAEDSMKNLSETTGGMLSTLSDVTMQLGAQVAETSGIKSTFDGYVRLLTGNLKRAIKLTQDEIGELTQGFQDLQKRALEPTQQNFDSLTDEFIALEDTLRAAIKQTSEGSEEYKTLSSMLEQVKLGSYALNDAVLAGLPTGEKETDIVKQTKEEFEAQYDAAKKLRREKQRLKDLQNDFVVSAEDEAEAMRGLATLYGNQPTLTMPGMAMDEDDEEFDPDEAGRIEAGEARLAMLGETQQMLESMKVSTMELASAVGEQLGSAFNSMVTGAKSAKEAFKQFAAGAIKAALAAAQASMIAAAIKDGMKAPFAMIAIPALIAAGMGIVDSAFGQIPKMADGGLFTGTSLALVGEGPGTSSINPEVVAPLDKLQSMMGGGNVTVTGMIRGTDILLSNERSALDRNRVRGF